MIHWKGQMKYMSHIKGFISVLLIINNIIITHVGIWAQVKCSHVYHGCHTFIITHLDQCQLGGI